MLTFADCREILLEEIEYVLAAASFNEYAPRIRAGMERALAQAEEKNWELWFDLPMIKVMKIFYRWADGEME